VKIKIYFHIVNCKSIPDTSLCLRNPNAQLTYVQTNSKKGMVCYCENISMCKTGTGYQ
jgi:hypothetical protein